MLCGQKHGCRILENSFSCLSFDFGRRIRLGKLIYLRHMYTQPGRAATPRNSDAHERIAVPKALCVLWEYTRPRPKSCKVRHSPPGHAGFLNRAKRSEGSDPPPLETPLFRPVSRCVCGSGLRRPVYPPQPIETNAAAFMRV